MKCLRETKGRTCEYCGAKGTEKCPVEDESDILVLKPIGGVVCSGDASDNDVCESCQ